MRTESLAAIDVHVHIEIDGHGHLSLDDELIDGVRQVLQGRP